MKIFNNASVPKTGDEKTDQVTEPGDVVGHEWLGGDEAPANTRTSTYVGTIRSILKRKIGILRRGTSTSRPSVAPRS